MKKFLLMFILLPYFINAQIEEDFRNINNLNETAWEGDLEKFIISSSQLILNDIDAGKASLKLKSPLSDYISWNIKLKLAFNPSENNFLCLSLLKSKNKEVKLILGKDSDKAELFYVEGVNETLISSSTEDFLSGTTNTIEINISKINDQWEVNINNNGIEQSLDFIQDFDYFENDYFGFDCNYTKTRSNKFSFEYFYIEKLVLVDTSAPKLLDFSIYSKNNFNLSFNEKLNEFSEKNIQLNDLNISDITTSDSANFSIEIHDEFISGREYELRLISISDKHYNYSEDKSYKRLFYKAQRGDLLINEIMYNPDEREDIYGREYIEIFNASKGKVSTSGMFLTVDEKHFDFGDKILEIDQYLLLLKESLPILEIDNEILNLNFNLNNQGSEIQIWSRDSTKIHSVKYSDSDFYKDFKAEEGSWSLELINPYNWFGSIDNYDFSTSINKGSPGEENSIYDSEFYPEKKTEISTVIYNQTLNILKIEYNGIIDNLKPNSFIAPATSFNLSHFENSSNHSIVELELGDFIHEYSRVYIEGLKTYNSERILPDTLEIGSFENASYGDLLINEILFNPSNNSNKFIELFNNSNKFINLKSIYISNYTEDELSNIKSICEEDFFMPPRSFFVICENVNSLKNNYTSGKRRFFKALESLPKMNINEGKLAILNSSLEIIDKVYYHEDMHHPMANSTKGVSLERINSDVNSLDLKNWNSASLSCGGATPGLENSIRKLNIETQNEIEVITKVFSPNRDGVNDYCLVAYKLNEANILANVKVFNSEGRFIREIANSLNLGSSGYFSWDGLDENGKIQPKGIYIIWIEFLSLNGKVQTSKFSIVLT